LITAHKAEREQVWQMAKRVANSYGLSIFDVQLRREAPGWVLRVILDSEDATAVKGQDGVSIENCQQVSRELSALLDVEDLLDQPYTLEISSPGLDRPLRHVNEYRRFIGKLAKIVISKDINGQHSLTGRIRKVTDDELSLDIGTQTHQISFSVITRGRLEVEL
jgi:ribosome maturation factor RimP